MAHCIGDLGLCTGFALHGSVEGVWHAQYSVTNVTGHPLSDDCTAVVHQAASQSAGRAEVINNVTVLLRGGPADTLQPLYAYGTNTQGGPHASCSLRRFHVTRSATK